VQQGAAKTTNVQEEKQVTTKNRVKKVVSFFV